MDSPYSDTIAAELHQWFQSVLDLTEKGLFGIVPEGPHRGAVVLDVLARNARLIADAALDDEGKLYAPVTLVLAAGSRQLSVALGIGHWRAAVGNVLRLRQQIAGVATSAAVALELGNPAAVFYHELQEALRQSGVTGVPSYLDDESRRIALGLALNWGMRFLLAYALACRLPPEPSGRKGLAWIAKTLSTTTASPP
ncbi:MAG: hypothetical protein AB1505_19980 [Candidatus Latescibacterota bacterium]